MTERRGPGRRPLDNPINIRTGVRFDAETMKRLEQYCQEKKITKGEAIRKSVIKMLDEQ